MRLKITFIFLAVLCLFSSVVNAQVNASRLAGYVKDSAGKWMDGAIVKATHVPSGTVYGAAVNSDGTYTIDNMRIGGPYTVTVSFGGTVLRTYTDIQLSLGETYTLDMDKVNSDKQLTGVIINARKDNLFNSQTTGASTIVDSEMIATLPSISRSVFDYTALTPQSNGSNFEGRNSAYNNVQLNGINFNNSFGLTSGFSGGGTPVSIDAIQQVQVAIADFDVRENGFTGANINVVTRQGTNELTGDAYTFYRNQSFNGTSVGPVGLPPASKTMHEVYGVSLGGPIIKNKLFFFVNGEYEQGQSPSTLWIANKPGITGANVSNVSADSMQEVSDYVKSKYGYNTGGYPGGPGFPSTFESKYLRLAARLDYNLNEKNKIDFSFNFYHDNLPILDNGTSAANGTLGNNRNSFYALSFANSYYSLVDNVSALSGEWLSTISSKVSNQLLVAYNQTRDTRSSPSSQFPFVDINYGVNSPSNDNYMSLGYELFTYKNDVQQNALTAYDNLTVHLGVNEFLAGVDFQYLTFANSYLPYGTSYYRYSSIQSFVNDQAPIGFGYTYPYAGQDGYSRVHYGLPGAYIQDKVSLLDNKLVLTGGVRADLPLYLNTLPHNKYIDTLNLADPSQAYNNGFGTAYKTTHYDATAWPKERVVVSPRFGFNWSPLQNGKLRIRGGSGVFLGQVPFVWLTNAPANAGVVTNNVQTNAGSVLANLKFQTTPEAALAELPQSVRDQYFPMQSGNSVPGLIAAVAPNFHMPEVWRSDLAADYKLPWLGAVATAEFLYTKELWSVYQFNANQPNPTGVLHDSNDHRPTYPGGQIYSFISGAYILANSTNGYGYSATIGGHIPVKNGFYGSLYYTRMYSSEVSANPGSQASSAWEGLDHLNTPNENIVAPSAYFAPNRYVGTLSYRYSYLKHFASTISLYYSGSNGGHFDWTYYDDINGNAINSSSIYGQMIYIPHTASELNWVPIETRTAFSTTIIYTVAQEEAAFNAFMSQDKYLNSHRGQYMQRNAETYPFYQTLNLRFIEDIISNIGKRHNSLQFAVDIINLPNLINRNWGIEKQLVVPYGSILNGSTNNGVTSYSLRTVYQVDNHGNTIVYGANGTTPYNSTTGTPGAPVPFLPTTSFVNTLSSSSTWGMQLSLKYNFW